MPLQRTATLLDLHAPAPPPPSPPSMSISFQRNTTQSQPKRGLVREGTKAAFQVRTTPRSRALDPNHFQPGSLHVRYESYTILRPRFTNEPVLYIPIGRSLAQQNPNRTLLLTERTMSLFHSEPALASEFNGWDDGMYVPWRAILPQSRILWRREWKFYKIMDLYDEVTRNVSAEVRRKNEVENRKDLTVTIRPLSRVVVVVKGKAMAVSVSPWSFHLVRTKREETRVVVEMLRAVGEGEEGGGKETERDEKDSQNSTSKPTKRTRYLAKSIKHKIDKGPMRKADLIRVQEARAKREVEIRKARARELALRRKEATANVRWRKAYSRMRSSLRWRSGRSGRWVRTRLLIERYGKTRGSNLS